MLQKGRGVCHGETGSDNHAWQIHDIWSGVAQTPADQPDGAIQTALDSGGIPDYESGSGRSRPGAD